MKRVSRRIPVRVDADVADAVFGRYAVVIQPVALGGPAGEISGRSAEGVAVMTLLVCCVRCGLICCMPVVVAVAGMALTTLLLLL
jgi:hypothetical protein